jgi:hypothetical protein
MAHGALLAISGALNRGCLSGPACYLRPAGERSCRSWFGEIVAGFVLGRSGLDVITRTRRGVVPRGGLAPGRLSFGGSPHPLEDLTERLRA